MKKKESNISTKKNCTQMKVKVGEALCYTYLLCLQYVQQKKIMSKMSGINCGQFSVFNCLLFLLYALI